MCPGRAMPVTGGRRGKGRAQRVFRPENVISEQYGCGNNWAMGYGVVGPLFPELRSAVLTRTNGGLRYNGRRGTEGTDGSLSHRCMEAMRREAERCDLFAGS